MNLSHPTCDLRLPQLSVITVYDDYEYMQLRRLSPSVLKSWEIAAGRVDALVRQVRLCGITAGRVVVDCDDSRTVTSEKWAKNLPDLTDAVDHGVMEEA